MGKRKPLTEQQYESINRAWANAIRRWHDAHADDADEQAEREAAQ